MGNTEDWCVVCCRPTLAAAAAAAPRLCWNIEPLEMLSGTLPACSMGERDGSDGVLTASPEDDDEKVMPRLADA